MAFGGPNVPHRTPRKRALEAGTSSGGFDGGTAYCAQCGCPQAMCKGHYKDPAESAAPVSRPSSGNPKPIKGG